MNKQGKTPNNKAFAADAKSRAAEKQRYHQSNMHPSKSHTMNIQKYMMRAIALSEENIKSGGGPFGAVIVKEDKIIGEGQNAVVTCNDPTAHAEIVAIRNACDTIKSYDLSGAIIFTSCEPCPMCLSAIWWSRIEKIYYGNTQKDASKIGFDDEEIYRELTRPISHRKLPLEQVLHDESIKVFGIWESYPDKTMY